MKFKLINESGYLHLVKGAFNRIIVFQTDSILNDFVRLHVEDIDGTRADKKLLITDKFYIYKSIWKEIMQMLYYKYLPHVKYAFQWDIEISPYTVMLCNLNQYECDTEFDLINQLLEIQDDNFETEYDSIIEKLGFETVGLKKGIEDFIPKKICPKTKKEQLNLLFRLMNFPPLGELSRFLNLYQTTIEKQLKDLSIGFSGIKEHKFPDFGTSESMMYSFFHFNHKIFEKYGLNGFEKLLDLKDFKSDFTKIRDRAAKNKDKISDEYICSCCGKKQNIKLPEEILHYKYLLENQELAKRIGLLHIEEFTESFIENLSEKFHSFLPNLNKVDNPDCLILVEGESEEISIPLLAFRKRFILSDHNIQVYNSKSKQKLKEDFFSFKEKYPNRKIICLLDSDALKEKEDIERVINNHKNQYYCCFVEKGTFEDIFDLNQSIDILNELYPDGEPIIADDFDQEKDFLSNIKKIMYFKKKAEFDKVLFAKTISLKMDIDTLPQELKDIFEMAELFTSKSKFIKK